MLWWKVAGASTSVSLTAGEATASLAAVTDFLFPVAFKIVVGTDEQDIEIVGNAQYQDIPSKTDRGEPEVAFFSGSTVYLWPVPQTNYTAKLTYEAIATDTASNTAPDVPISMLRALADVVAYDVLGDFQIKEASVIQRVTSRYPEARRTIYELNQERVDTSTVTPEWF